MLSSLDTPPHRKYIGFAFALFTFFALGTVSAIWENPFFIRMTPVDVWELPVLAVLSALAGIFLWVRRPACSVNQAGVGSLAGFLGIACPTCNKILMLIFGGEALMRWFDPARPLISALGIALLGFAIRREMRLREISPVAQPVGGGQT